MRKKRGLRLYRKKMTSKQPFLRIKKILKANQSIITKNTSALTK